MATRSLDCMLTVASKAVARRDPRPWPIHHGTLLKAAVDLDRPDVVDRYLDLLPTTERDMALFSLASIVGDRDQHCGEALNLLGNIDLAASRTDRAASNLVRAVTRCGTQRGSDADRAQSRIMAEVLFESSGELHAFVNGRLREIPGVDRVESMILLERVKETHDWGVPERDQDD